MGKYFAVLLLTPFFFGGVFFYAHAHEGEEHSASYNLAAVSIAQDEVVDPSSLGAGTTDVLPGHPFYFFKNVSRGFRSTFAFSAEKRAELKLQFASEKIVEAQLLLERGDNNRAAEHLKSYEKDLARAKGIVDKEKFITQSIKHQAVIDKIEKEASEEQALDIKSVREKTIEHVAEAVASIEDKEAAKNVLIYATSDEGSAFKPLRNLEVLKAVEEKVPEQAKEAIRSAQENAVKRFKSDYDKGTEEEKAALTDYIKSAGGDASRYIEAFNENKEVLGDDLFQVVKAAGEEKKAAAETKSPSASSLQSVESECFPPVPPKPNVEQHSFGTMTVTPEVSKAGEDNTITISLSTHINALAIQLSSSSWVPFGEANANVIDWGPKQPELNGGKGTTIVNYDYSMRWDTYGGYLDDNKQPQKRPLLRAKEYWIKIKAPRKTIRDRSNHDGEFGSYGNFGPYGWKEVKYEIAYVVGDTAIDKDIKYVRGNDFFYIGGPQYPVGEIVRAGANTKSPGAVRPGGSLVTVKAGEPFEIEAKPTGWQGGVMTLTIPLNDRRGNGGRIIGSDTFTVKAGESAIWKVLPTGPVYSPVVRGYVSFTNNCDRFFTEQSSILGTVPRDTRTDSFDLGIKFDFKGLAKENAKLDLHGAVAYALGFGKPDSSFDITPALSLMDGKSYVANVPGFTLELAAVYKDNPQEIVKSVLITPRGKAQQAGSATGVTNKDGETVFKITAPNATRQEITRGILLRATAPAIPGLKATETKLIFTNISIEVTPTPVVEKKEEPKAEPKVEPKIEPKVEEPKPEPPKPYEGSPPLLY